MKKCIMLAGDLILAALQNLQNGNSSPEEVLRGAENSVRECLRDYGVSENMPNAFQIASLISAYIDPSDSFSRFVISAYKSGKLPEFSESCDVGKAVERAIAGLVAGMEDSLSLNALKLASQKISAYIRETDYLPDERGASE